LKAKEYYEKYHEFIKSEDSQVVAKAINDAIKDYLKECNSLITSRHIRCFAALVAILKEQNQKYNAFCRMFDPRILKEDGFKVYINDCVMPELKDKW